MDLETEQQLEVLVARLGALECLAVSSTAAEEALATEIQILKGQVSLLQETVQLLLKRKIQAVGIMGGRPRGS